MSNFKEPWAPVVAPPTVTIPEQEDEAEAEPRRIDFGAERSQVATTAGTGGHGAAWEPVKVVLAATAGRDGVPTVDDNLDDDPHAAPRVYPSWRSEETFVVSRPRDAGSRLKARREILDKFGHILEEAATATKWCFRVYRPGKAPIPL